VKRKIARVSESVPSQRKKSTANDDRAGTVAGRAAFDNSAELSWERSDGVVWQAVISDCMVTPQDSSVCGTTQSSWYQNKRRIMLTITRVEGAREWDLRGSRPRSWVEFQLEAYYSI
jgi:hypothetical protein